MAGHMDPTPTIIMLGQNTISISERACKWSRDQELHHNISKNRFSFSSAKCVVWLDPDYIAVTGVSL